MKFREHKGSIEDSMATLVEVDDFDSLLSHMRKITTEWPSFPPITRETVQVSPYGWDPRIKWDTYIVVLDGYGVMGYTDEVPK